MRVGNELPSVYFQNTLPRNYTNSAIQTGGQTHNLSGQGVLVDISPRGWAAYNQVKASEDGHAPGCETCDSRRYQDNSNDPSVSFQFPTHIRPEQSAAAVAAHEAEHVANERASAEQEGSEIVSQTVRLITSICPECKLTYVAGGETHTVSRPKGEAVDIEA